MCQMSIPNCAKNGGRDRSLITGGVRKSVCHQINCNICAHIDHLYPFYTEEIYGLMPGQCKWDEEI